MDRKTKFLSRLQNIMGRFAIFIVGPVIIIALKCLRYKVRDLRITRAVARALFEEHRGPWIICPNHLTMIDSLILAYAMVPLYRYMTHYQLLPWNLPERANFQRNIFLSCVCYLTKCIPISRGGDRKRMKQTLEKCTHLLTQGDNLMVFPEGGRSRTGRVDVENFSYGVGRLLSNVPECRVMCVYMRGEGQTAYSTVPRFGETFSLKIEVATPRITETGLKAQRASAQQIIEHLAEMENEYFASRGKRHRGPHSPAGEREKPRYALSQQGLHRWGDTPDPGARHP